MMNGFCVHNEEKFLYNELTNFSPLSECKHNK